MRKILVYVIIVLIVVLGGVGFYLFSNYDSKKVDMNTDFINANKEEVDEGRPLGELENIYSDKDAVIEAIERDFLYGSGKAKFVSEDEECWYFEADNGKKYGYCFIEGVIKEVIQ